MQTTEKKKVKFIQYYSPNFVIMGGGREKFILLEIPKLFCSFELFFNKKS